MKRYNLEATGNSEIIGIHDAITLQPIATIKPADWELANLFKAAPQLYEALGTIKRTAESSGDNAYYLQNCLSTIVRIAKEARTMAEGK